MFLHLSDNDWRLASIYNQILRSGTSISANVHESEFAQSPQDFASKLSIALKEANETINWLNLLKDTGYLSETQFDSMAKDCSEIIALLVSSIKTIKKNTINNKKKNECGMKNEEWLVSPQHSSSSALPSVRAAILHSSFFILHFKPQ